jgi:ComF family protein
MNILGVARSALSATMDLLLPRACVACDGALAASERGVVCGRCWARLIPIPAPQCERCGHPHIHHSCRWCPLLPPYVRAVRSVCWMPGGSTSAIVHALKYEGWHAIAAGLGERMARVSWPRDVVDERAAVVPVPLARSRMRERGFNQSSLIARELSARWHIPLWEDVLQRTRETGTQTQLTPGDRLRNVAGAFRAAPAAAHARLTGAHVVLVDDVVTTAATLNACAAALLEGGARIISYVTFGRARLESDRAP